MKITKPSDKCKALEQSIAILNKLIAEYESEQFKDMKRKDSMLNIKIIPNVKRIKIEKVAVAKELFSQQSEQKDISLSVDMNQTVDLDALKNIPLYSYYYENVFSLEDFYLYRAVFHFYSRDYQNAIADFEQC